jgi:hypothetical protein
LERSFQLLCPVPDHGGGAQGKHAVTKAPWAFKSGEQLFENYGQPNHIYFSYHGFVLDNNTHDCVVLPLGINPVDSPDVQAVWCAGDAVVVGSRGFSVSFLVPGCRGSIESRELPSKLQPVLDRLLVQTE